ncbi:hypothetical protein ACFQ0G_53810 [Streptomyces chiangmaiensis]
MPDKTQGQQFAEQMRYFLSIGTRTRRNRKGGDLHRDIADWIKSAAMEPGTFPLTRKPSSRPPSMRRAPGSSGSRWGVRTTESATT